MTGPLYELKQKQHPHRPHPMSFISCQMNRHRRVTYISSTNNPSEVVLVHVSVVLSEPRPVSRLSSSVFPYRCRRWWAAWRGNHSPAPWPGSIPPHREAVQEAKPPAAPPLPAERQPYMCFNVSPGLFWAVSGVSESHTPIYTRSGSDAARLAAAQTNPAHYNSWWLTAQAHKSLRYCSRSSSRGS